MKPLSEIIDILLEKALAKRYGIAFAKIFCNWNKIVGTKLAPISAPKTIHRFDKILIVNIYDKNQAARFYFEQEIFVQRINILLDSKNIPLNISKIILNKITAN